MKKKDLKDVIRSLVLAEKREIELQTHYRETVKLKEMYNEIFDAFGAEQAEARRERALNFQLESKLREIKEIVTFQHEATPEIPVLTELLEAINEVQS